MRSGAVDLGSPNAPASALQSPCPEHMLLVDGLHCPNPVHECLDYLSVERDRCRLYSSSSPCIGVPQALRFCIDAYEYPNLRGEKPKVWVSYLEANEHCAKAGKRLCTSREWELACEGPERLPYATGYARDPTRCNYDRQNIVADQDALANPRKRDAEFARVDQRDAAGSHPDCVSYYGVYDLTGNVDEWVVFERGNYDKAPFRSALKGGYWGRVRNRCRPTTTDHNAWHSGYQVGFRCCAEATRRNGTEATEGDEPVSPTTLNTGTVLDGPGVYHATTDQGSGLPKPHMGVGLKAAAVADSP